MIDSAHEISAALPLTVDNVVLDNPILTLRGDRWGLTVSCPWKLVGLGTIVDSEAEDLSLSDVTGLVGSSIDTITTRASV